MFVGRYMALCFTQQVPSLQDPSCPYVRVSASYYTPFSAPFDGPLNLITPNSNVNKLPHLVSSRVNWTYDMILFTCEIDQETGTPDQDDEREERGRESRRKATSCKIENH